MGVEQGYSKIATSGLVFAYDTGDTVNSYIGEPTTNVMRQSNNVTGSQYGYNDEYSACQLVKTWVPNLPTPVGTGATLLTEQNAGSSYLYCLNWYDDSEDDKRCLSAYIYPLSSGITNFTIGMVGDFGKSAIFNLDSGAITAGGGISSANTFYAPVPGYPGWYRVGANIEGRVGGWVASIGLGQAGGYTPSTPFKSFYICGIQYERNIATHCTQFTPAGTTRSSTQGLLDISGGGSSINLASVSFNSNAMMNFDGTDDTVSIPSNSSNNVSGNITMELILRRGAASAAAVMHKEVQYTLYITAGGAISYADSSYWSYNGFGYHGNVTTDTYHHLVATKSGSLVTIYLDGNTVISQNFGSAISQTNNTLYIGSYNGGSNYFNGYIPVSKVYSKALTANEVLQNYNHYKTRFNIT